MKFFPYRMLLVFLCLASFGYLAAQPTPAPTDRPTPITLRFLVWDGDKGLRILRPAIRAFEEKYPHITVDLESITQNYQEVLLAQFAADVAPDVAMMDMNNFQRFARRDAILPLNQFFDDIPGFDINSYYRPIVEAHSYRGELFVLPRDIAPIGIIYYNKEAFREAGLELPDGNWTWDFQARPHLREQCFIWVLEQLTKRNERGRTVRWAYSAGWATLTAEMFATSMGARMADNYESPTRVLMDDPRWIRSFEFTSSMWLEHGWVPSPTELTSQMQTTAWQLFAAGRVAMYQSGIWDVPNIRDAIGVGEDKRFDWDITLAPGWINPETGEVQRSAPTGGSGYAILSSTKHPREAWLLAEWMAGEPGMQAMAAAGYAQPAIQELALQAPWIPDENTPIELREPQSRIFTDTAVPYVHFNPTSDLWPEVMGLVGREYERLFNGSVTAEYALTKGTANANRRLQTLLAEQDLPRFNWWAGLAIGIGILAAVLWWVYWPERNRKLTYRQKKENVVGYLFIMPWVLGMLLFTLGPMILSLLMSFADWDIIRPAMWRGAQNYVEAFTIDPRFYRSLAVTFIYALFAVPLGLFGSLMLALLLNIKVRGMPIYRTCYYLPSIASGVVAALIWRRIFQPEGGLLNTFIYGPDGTWNTLGIASFLDRFNPNPGQPVNWLANEMLALPGFIFMSLWGIGGGMIILLAGLQAIPQHYYEAATVDGANIWKKFRNVTLPLLTPSLFFTLVTGIIGAMQVFTQAFVMTGGGPNDTTRFYMLHLYEAAFVGLRMGYASAMAWVLFVIILIITLFQFKFSKWVYYEGGSR